MVKWLGKILIIIFLLSLSVNVDAIKIFGAAADGTTPPSKNLTITLLGSGTGTVTSSPAGISCPPTCSANFTTGTTVTITAVANSGSAFVSFSGGGCSTSPCVILLNVDTVVSATFNLTCTYARLDKINLVAGEIDPTGAVIDTVNGFLYFGHVNVAPSIITKVNLNTFTRVGSITLNAGENNIVSGVIDVQNQVAYFVTSNIPAKLIKIDLSTFTRVGALTLDPSGLFGSTGLALIDTVNQIGYFNLSASGSDRIVRVNLNTFTLGSTLVLAGGEQGVATGVIDIPNQLAYIGTRDAAPEIIKLNLSTFTRVSAIPIGPSIVQSAGTSVIDLTNQIAYFGTQGQGPFDPGRVHKINLSTFTLVASVDDTGPGKNFTGSVIDLVNNKAYFGSRTATGAIFVVDLNTFTRQTTILPGDPFVGLQGMVIDSANSRFYVVGTPGFGSPGHVVRYTCP